MISSRYAPELCVLIALALVPTLIHSYGGVHEDGRSTAMIPAALAGYRSSPSERNSGWGKRRFDSDDWMEREYVKAGDEVRLTVIRSYDPKSLYHHPELAITDDVSFSGTEIHRTRLRPEIPVHVLQPSPGVTARAMYVLFSDGRFVEDPIWFQLRSAGELLVSPRKPMTLLFAHDLNVPENQDVDALPSMALLLAAVDSFVTARLAN